MDYEVKTYCRVYVPLSIEHRGSEFGLIRRNMSLACCLCSCNACSVCINMYSQLVAQQKAQVVRYTCSSSTLAASGRASDARTIIVERTMVEGLWLRSGDGHVAVNQPSW
jgi:hypothetical protein